MNFFLLQGFNVETISPCRGITLTVWDVGGQDHLRTLWHHYFDNVDGLVFVIDSTDRYRLLLSKAELKGIYQHDSMKNAPLVVIANKQDSPDALSAEAIAEKLDLNQWPNGSFHIIPCSALTGDGLTDAFTTLAKMIRKQSKNRRLETN
jgi:ADP-ribosylation factor protein 1